MTKKLDPVAQEVLDRLSGRVQTVMHDGIRMTVYKLCRAQVGTSLQGWIDGVYYAIGGETTTISNSRADSVYITTDPELRAQYLFRIDAGTALGVRLGYFDEIYILMRNENER